MEHVQVRSTFELDNGTSREFRGASVQTDIFPTDNGDAHVPCGVLFSSLAQKTGFLSFLAKVELAF